MRRHHNQIRLQFSGRSDDFPKRFSGTKVAIFAARARAEDELHFVREMQLRLCLRPEDRRGRDRRELMRPLVNVNQLNARTETLCQGQSEIERAEGMAREIQRRHDGSNTERIFKEGRGRSGGLPG